MKKSIKILTCLIVLIICIFSLDFLWILYSPVPKENHSVSDLYLVKPGMAPPQILKILGQPISMKIYTTGEKCGKVSAYYDDFEKITKDSQKSTWVFSNEDYFDKTLEIYINFSSGNATRIVVERDDYALYLYESGKQKPTINKNNLLCLYLNP